VISFLRAISVNGCNYSPEEAGVLFFGGFSLANCSPIEIKILITEKLLYLNRLIKDIKHAEVAIIKKTLFLLIKKRSLLVSFKQIFYNIC